MNFSKWGGVGNPDPPDTLHSRYVHVKVQVRRIVLYRSRGGQVPPPQKKKPKNKNPKNPNFINIQNPNPWDRGNVFEIILMQRCFLYIKFCEAVSKSSTNNRALNCCLGHRCFTLASEDISSSLARGDDPLLYSFHKSRNRSLPLARKDEEIYMQQK